ncbi:MAG TPA: hypothetical protein VEI97_16420, partial [bacterium]|nr:hypothetical protein [bacterium]
EDVFLRDEGGSGAGYTSVRLYTKKPEGADPRLTNIGFILRYENAETARLNAGSSATKTLWGKFVLEFDDYNPKATARARDEIKKALGL